MFDFRELAMAAFRVSGLGTEGGSPWLGLGFRDHGCMVSFV